MKTGKNSDTSEWISREPRFNHLKHKIFSDFTRNKTNLLISELEEKLLHSTYGSETVNITHVMLKLLR